MICAKAELELRRVRRNDPRKDGLQRMINTCSPYPRQNVLRMGESSAKNINIKDKEFS
jgi:hypothetical protein